MRLLRALSPALLALTLLVGGCGGEEMPKPTNQPSPNEGQPPAAAPARTPPQLQRKPKVEKGRGSPPKQLKTKDIIEGKGKAAAKGSQLTVNYVGILFESGKEFDASWERKQPFPFKLGEGTVIPGWDKGLEGMKVGGRRRLTIPPEQAYGEQGSPPAIGPNETLIFVIDLLNVQ